MLDINKLYCMDCIDGMAKFPDKYFDLAIVDPPYFSGPNKRKYYGGKSTTNIARREYPIIDTWDIPQKDYFDELMRVSKQQIIWGCNYFRYPFGPGRIVWDKCNDGTSFSDCEIAYCSMHDSVRIFRFMWNGMMQGKSIAEGNTQKGDKSKNEKRIHPCQKPIALYDWLIGQYLPSGGKVLDTHVGSASSLIACHKAGCDFVGFEKSRAVFDLAVDRLESEIQQLTWYQIAEGGDA